jgi:hypothetical protein
MQLVTRVFARLRLAQAARSDELRASPAGFHDTPPILPFA